MIDLRGNVIVTLQNLRPSSDFLEGSMRTVVVSSRNSRAKTIDLRKIQIPEIEIGVECVKLDYETSRGRLRQAENQRLQAEIAENSYRLPQTKPKWLSDWKCISAVTQSVQRDRHFVHNGSHLYTINSNCRTQTESLRHALYESTDELVSTISGSRIRSKLIVLTLIHPSASAAQGSRQRMRFTGYIFQWRQQSKEIMKHV